MPAWIGKGSVRGETVLNPESMFHSLLGWWLFLTEDNVNSSKFFVYILNTLGFTIENSVYFLLD